MKDSLPRVPKMGVPLRGSTKKNHRRDSKSHVNPNSEDIDDSSTVSLPLQNSTITDDLSATSSNSTVKTAGDLDEVGSNCPVLPLVFDNSNDPAILPEFSESTLTEHIGSETYCSNEAITLAALDPLTEEIGGGGGCCYMDEISTGFLNAVNHSEAQIVTAKGSDKDGEEGRLEVAMVGFSNAVENLRSAIREMMMSAIEQRNRNGGEVVFSLSRLGETALACFVSAVLVSVLVAAVTPEPEGCWNNLSAFSGPSPTCSPAGGS